MSTCNYDYKTKVFSYKYYFSFFFVYNPQDKYLRQEIRKRSFLMLLTVVLLEILKYISVNGF